jgi:NADH pyrophosphatase NudC (nudix superfamily)
MTHRQVFVDYDRQVGSTEGQFEYCPFCGQTLIPKELDHRLRPTCPCCDFAQFQNPAPTVSVLIVEGEQILLGRKLNGFP